MTERARQDRDEVQRAAQAGRRDGGARANDALPRAGDLPEDELFGDPFDRPSESTR